jgi:hypothetical protein
MSLKAGCQSRLLEDECPNSYHFCCARGHLLARVVLVAAFGGAVVALVVRRLGLSVLMVCGLIVAHEAGAQTPAQRQAAAGFFDEAWRLREAGDHRGAIGRFQQGLAIVSDAQASFLLGRSLEAVGQLREARAAYQQAVRTDRESQHGIMAASEIARLDRAFAEARAASLQRLRRFGLEVVTDPSEVRRLTATIRQSTSSTNCLVFLFRSQGNTIRATQIWLTNSSGGAIDGLFSRNQLYNGEVTSPERFSGEPHIAFASVRLSRRDSNRSRILAIVPIPEDIDSKSFLTYFVVAQDGLRPVYANSSISSLDGGNSHTYSGPDITRASPDCS